MICWSTLWCSYFQTRNQDRITREESGETDLGIHLIDNFEIRWRHSTADTRIVPYNVYHADILSLVSRLSRHMIWMRFSTFLPTFSVYNNELIQSLPKTRQALQNTLRNVFSFSALFRESERCGPWPWPPLKVFHSKRLKKENTHIVFINWVTPLSCKKRYQSFWASRGFIFLMQIFPQLISCMLRILLTLYVAQCIFLMCNSRRHRCVPSNCERTNPKWMNSPARNPSGLPGTNQGVVQTLSKKIFHVNINGQQHYFTGTLFTPIWRCKT